MKRTSLGRRHCLLALGLSGTLLAACAAGGPTDGERPNAGEGSPNGGAAAPPGPPPPSDNVIDVAIWPRMVAAGATKLAPASSGELCRRVSLDLLGAAPTSGEVAMRCTGKSALEMARAAMADPRYIAREQRLWIQHLRPDPTEVQADHIVDGDKIIARFAKGEIGYDTFAAQLLGHPVMAINRRVIPGGDDLTDISRNAFRVFLGRAPLTSEAVDFSHLYLLWHRDFVPVDGFNYYVRPARLRAERCAYTAAGCSSTLLGPPTSIDLPEGQRDVPYLDFQGNVPPAVQTELEKPGRLLAMRAEFWEHSADQALRRFLGWWEASAAQPDTVVPEVRLALASWFRATPGRDVRTLYETIITSLLYTTTSELDPIAGADPPPWTMGPMKPMSPEQWLDSISVAIERPLGFCDMHTNEPPGRNWYWANRLRTPAPTGLTVESNFYFDNAQALGGCLGGVAPPSAPGMPSFLTQIDVGERLCKFDVASKLAPTGFDASDASEANLERLVAFQFGHFLTRAPYPDEVKTITETAGTCLPDMSCGVKLFAEQLCGALTRSSSFYFY